MSREILDSTIRIDWTDKIGMRANLHSGMSLQEITELIDLRTLKKALALSGNTFHALQREVNLAQSADHIEQKGNILYMDHSVHRSEEEIVRIVLQSLYIYSKYLEQHVFDIKI